MALAKLMKSHDGYQCTLNIEDDLDNSDISKNVDNSMDKKIENIFSAIRNISITMRKSYTEKNLDVTKKNLKKYLCVEIPQDFEELMKDDEGKEKMRRYLIDKTLDKGEERCKNQDGNNKNNLIELLFYATHKTPTELQEALNKIDETLINQTRDHDTVIISLLQYGDSSKDDFYKCVEMLLDNNVDLNKCDYRGRLPLDHLKNVKDHEPNFQTVIERLEQKMRELKGHHEKELLERVETDKAVRGLNRGGRNKIMKGRGHHEKELVKGVETDKANRVPNRRGRNETMKVEGHPEKELVEGVETDKADRGPKRKGRNETTKVKEYHEKELLKGVETDKADRVSNGRGRNETMKEEGHHEKELVEGVETDKADQVSNRGEGNETTKVEGHHEKELLEDVKKDKADRGPNRRGRNETMKEEGHHEKELVEGVQTDKADQVSNRGEGNEATKVEGHPEKELLEDAKKDKADRGPNRRGRNETMKVKNEFFDSDINVLTKLRFWLIHTEKVSTDDYFLKKHGDDIEKCINDTTDEYNIFQLAILLRKKQDVLNILIENGADINVKTQLCDVTPLESAAKIGKEGFKILLDHKKTAISEETYRHFSDGNQRYFKEILQSNKLSCCYTTEDGNTPLHYAAKFSMQETFQHLVLQGANLIVKNRFGDSPLNLLDLNDLKSALDDCLILDHYYNNICNSNYKMQLNYNFLIPKDSDGSNCNQNELDVLYQISINKKFEKILTHPLIESFVNLKWHISRMYFWVVFIFQFLMFSLLSLVFFSLISKEFSDVRAPLTLSGMMLCFINCLVKVYVFFRLDVAKQVPLHWAFELVSLITMLILLFTYLLFGYVIKQLLAFIFIELAVCMLLTLGYSEKFSQWSVMLQTVFKNFIILALFFTIPLVAFAAGFYTLFSEGRPTLFQNASSSVVKTLAMLAGDIDTENLSSHSELHGIYLFFTLFVVCMTIILMNFWTGFAVTDIENIRKVSENNRLKNMILFLKFAERMYKQQILWFKKPLLENPFIFSGKMGDSTNIDCKIDFFLNKDKHLKPEKANTRNTGLGDLPNRLEECSYLKIRELCQQKIIENEKEKKLKKKNEEREKKKKDFKELYERVMDIKKAVQPESSKKTN